jgi:predicted GNAT family acetyltransferase
VVASSALLTTVSENRAAHRVYASLGFETAYEVLLYDKSLAM